MIPTRYMLALIATTLLLLYRLVDVQNKYVNILLNCILSFLTASSWVYVFVREYNIHLWGQNQTTFSTLIIVLLAGLIIGFIIMVFTWKEPIYIPKRNIATPTYDENTLIGMTGTVIDGHGNQYIGILDDEVGTNVLFYTDNEVAKHDDKFTITELKNSQIYAKIIG